MKAYDLIFKKSHQIRETILAKDGDTAASRAREMVDELCDEEGVALEFLWLEEAKADQPFFIGGKKYLTDIKTLRALANMFPIGNLPHNAAKQMECIVLGQSLSRIVEVKK